jgi:LysM repeat protein
VARPQPAVTLRQARTGDGDAPDRSAVLGLPRRLRAMLTGPRRMTVVGLVLLVAGVVVAGLATLQASPHTPVAAAPAISSVTAPGPDSSSTPTPAAPSSTPVLPSTPAPSDAPADPAIATPAAARPDTGSTVISVQAGDTLWALARRYGTTVPALQELNGLGDSTRIDAGQPLRVPAGPGQLPAPATASALPAVLVPAAVPSAPTAPSTPPASTAAAAIPPSTVAASPLPTHRHHRHPRDQRAGQRHPISQAGLTNSAHSHPLPLNRGTTAMTCHRHTHAQHTQPATHGKSHR